MLVLVYGEQSPGKITAWYDQIWRHWRWRCELCSEEHGTTAIDPDYEGPALTAIYNHIDVAHPGMELEIEIKNADGDLDNDD